MFMQRKGLDAFQLCITSGCSVDNQHGKIEARKRQKDSTASCPCYSGINGNLEDTFLSRKNF